MPGPNIISLVKQGTLTLSALDDTGNEITGDGFVDPSCQVINVRLEPNNDGESAADQEETLGGCLIDQSESGEDNYDQLTGQIVADHNVVELLTAWTWRYKGQRARALFTPRLAPEPEVEGSSYTAEAMEFDMVIAVSRLVVGGDVDQRNDIDFAFDVVSYNSLPVPYGGVAPTP